MNQHITKLVRQAWPAASAVRPHIQRVQTLGLMIATVGSRVPVVSVLTTVPAAGVIVHPATAAPVQIGNIKQRK